MLANNETPFAATGFEQMHRDGQRMAVAAVRACYELRPDGRLTRAPSQSLSLSDIYDGGSHAGPLVRVSDLAAFKPAADVTFLGRTFLAEDEDFDRWAAGVRVGEHTYVLRVCGPRQWRPESSRPGAVFRLTKAAACRSVSIDYRSSSGGRLIGEPRGEADPRNPIGPGLIDAKYTSPMHSYEAPAIDSELEAVGDPLARPEPQGFGPISPAWRWRQRFAGTYGEDWLRDQYPRLPRDFDYRFYQCAHPNLIMKGYLRAGTRTTLGRLTPGGGVLDFFIPDEEPYAIFKWIDGREVKARCNRDGLHIDLRRDPPWPVEITFRCWVEICPRFMKLDLAYGDEAGAASLPVSNEFGLAEPRT